MTEPEVHDGPNGIAAAEDRPRIALAIAATLLTVLVVGLYLPYRDRTAPAVPSPPVNGSIYFLSYPDRETGDRSMFAVEPDGSNFRRISLPGRSFVRVSVSPDGRRIAMASGGFDVAGNVFVADIDGSGLLRLTRDAPNLGPLGGHPDIHPTWSPDSHQIVFSSTRCCDTETGLGNYALYVVRPDGSGMRQLTDGSQSAWSPAWSPDGSLIAYAANLRALWVIGADGSNPRALPTMGVGRFIKALAWSPDGKEIAFGTQGLDNGELGPSGTQAEDFQIRVIRRDGSGERTIYTCKEVCRFGGYSLQWSPDGAQIAFTFGRVKRKGVAWRIATIAPDGTGLRILDTHDVPVSDFSWARAE